MENLKKIVNAQTHVFGNFQHMATHGQKSLSWAQVVSKFEIFFKFHVEELNGEVYFDLP